MRDILSLIAGLIAIAYVIYSFFGGSEYELMFGYEVNIWAYRLIWTLLAAMIFYGYYRRKKLGR